MNPEEENPFPDDAAVFVRYPVDPPSPGGYGPVTDWPWLPGEVIERCNQDEWKIAVLERRLATLEDGSPAPEGTPLEDLVYPTCFRDADELMLRPDDGSTPDGPVVQTTHEYVDSLGKQRLAADLQLLVGRLTQLVTPVQMWAGSGPWAAVDEPARTAAGVGALYNLITVLAQFGDLCVRLHHSGCASNHYDHGLLAAARELLTKTPNAVPRYGVVISGGSEHSAVDTPDPGETAGNELQAAQLGAAAGEPVDDATWMRYFDAVMDFAKPTEVQPPPDTP